MHIKFVLKVPDNISKISLEIVYKVCDGFFMSFVKHRDIKSLKKSYILF